MSGQMDEDTEAAHRAWVLWLNGDKDMPIWGVALMHDLVTCFYQEATGHERLAMIGRFPLLVELYNVAWWVVRTENQSKIKVRAPIGCGGSAVNPLLTGQYRMMLSRNTTIYPGSPVVFGTEACVKLYQRKR